MRAIARWFVGGVLWVPVFLACGSSGTGGTFGNGPQGGSSSSGGDDAGSTTGIDLGDGSSQVVSLGDATLGGGGGSSNSPCKAGHYVGTFTGTYSSHLTLIGIAIPVSGNVSLDLDSAGKAGTTCTFDGEEEDCSSVFTLQNGTITGVADGTEEGDGAVTGGYPYFCSMTGTLDCKTDQLVGGWIECTYCLGPLADGGQSCVAFGSGDGCNGDQGLGGKFAGILTANYDPSTHAFVDGTWNGAEVLACNDGGVGPDGGPAKSYLTLDGGYGIGNFGGAGDWNAAFQ